MQPVSDPAFWRERLAAVNKRGAPLHHAVFICPTEQWVAVERKHRRILARHIAPSDSVFDAGCGYGRLLSLLPEAWAGPYLGVDVSPDLLALAKAKYGGLFEQMDLRDLSGVTQQFQWAVLISVRPMVKRELGSEAWSLMEQQIRRVARKLLYLEYDPEDEGSVE